MICGLPPRRVARTRPACLCRLGDKRPHARAEFINGPRTLKGLLLPPQPRCPDAASGYRGYPPLYLPVQSPRSNFECGAGMADRTGGGFELS